MLGHETLKNTITTEQSLVAHFKQPSGPSRRGVDWMVRISGEHNLVVIVRTYFSSDAASEDEKQLLARRATELVRTKLEQGWTPVRGMLEA
jgi:hypothetical protein